MAFNLIIGVAAVITIVALGSGASESIEDSVEAAGTNLIVISAGNRTFGGVRLGLGASSRLTPEDALAIRRVAGVRDVSAGCERDSSWWWAARTGRPR